MRASSPQEHSEPSLPLFFLTLVTGLSGLLAGLRLFAPTVWAQQLHSAPWRGAAAFFIISLVNCLVEYFFHRYVLHAAALPFLSRLYRQHARHHATKHIAVKKAADGRDVLFIENPPATTTSSSRLALFFPWYSFLGLALLLSPLLVVLQWLLPSFPWLVSGFAALAVSLSFYELLSLINRWTFDKWTRLMGHPFWKKFWQPIYAFQLHHYAVPHCNQSISGFFGLPLADWIFGTFITSRSMQAEGETWTWTPDTLRSPRPGWFIRRLDALAQRRLPPPSAAIDVAAFPIADPAPAPAVSKTRRCTPAEEIANWITHGIGAVLSFIGLVLLVIFSINHGDLWHVSSFTVFGITLLALYTTSTLYHAHRGSKKLLLRKLDHAAIFLLIAGTYTPFLLTSLRGPWGWTLFGIIWGICGTGAIVKIFAGERYGLASTLAYLFAGWLIVVALKPLIASVPQGGLQLLVAGGLCYTFGVVFFLWEKLYYHHAVWHLFVLAGSICHYLAVILFLLPAKA